MSNECQTSGALELTEIAYISGSLRRRTYDRTGGLEAATRWLSIIRHAEEVPSTGSSVRHPRSEIN